MVATVLRTDSAHACLAVARLWQHDQIKALVAAPQLVELPLHHRINIGDVQRIRRLEDARLERTRMRLVGPVRDDGQNCCATRQSKGP